MANTDEKVLELFAVVQKKKEEIAKAEKPNWLTNCSFRFDKESNSTINIQTVSDVNRIVELLAFLYDKRKSFDDAAKDLGVESKFNWFGFSVEDWKTDFQTRINKIQITKKKQELETMETRLNSLISPELKRQMELELISKQLLGDEK